MHIKLRSFFKIEKKGNTIEEYEDAVAFNKEQTVFAVADGATEASFSREWANILANHFVENPVLNINDEWLTEAYKKFYQSIDIDSLPWHAQNKVMEQGSFSTLLGFMINKRDNLFSIIAVGDTCIFWREPNGNTSPFPIRNEEDFNNNPYLIGTFRDKNEALTDKEHQFVFHPQSLLEGITAFYLMTDALAHWFIKQCANKKDPYESLNAIKHDDDFSEFLSLLRDKEQIKNDDVTLVIIEVSH